MSVFTKKSTVIITCHKRVSGYLAQEVTDLGFIIEETFVTGNDYGRFLCKYTHREVKGKTW